MAVESGLGALDRRAVIRGAVAYLTIAVPCGLLIAVAQPSDTSGLWAAAAVLVFLVAPVMGGAFAGAAAGHRSPLTHAAVAVAGPAAVFLVVRLLVGIGRGNLSATQVVSFILYLVVFTGLAVVGGYVAFRRRGRPSASL
jgi:hypothetical protein